ncbi:Coatomer subunit alpha [Mycena chlorophos]|uniref:Coatomer subunit alpha n=1 Tax=Mycena chlorophos TaxID=658473 RepID=A0A8H6SZJ5_MYCCL|nr:Coatomer subunit alpha [Mycena chlorophos]
MLVMLTKFESKSTRVKGLAFHPTQPLLAAALDNGSIQLWMYRMGVLVDRFEEHEGPVRPGAVSFHPSRALLASGGDDHKIKVWDIRPQNRRCLFTLYGHLDFVRMVQFHHEMPWIISCSDDQTVRIWNGTSRNCIAIPTGHSHYVMSAFFHPKDDLVVSASVDQTVRVSGLRKGLPNQGTASKDTTVASTTTRPSPLIVSAANDRTIRMWRMSETKAWEIVSCRGHMFNNVSTAVLHPKHELIVSCGEGKTVRVWDLANRTAIQTFRREDDRFWVLASHPDLNLFAAGHNTGLIVFKLERERPAFVAHQDSLYYIRDKYVRSYDFNTGADLGLLSVRKFGSVYVPPRKLSFNSAERAVLVTISSDNGLYELTGLPQQAQGELKDSSVDGKRGAGQSAIFVARNRFVILNKTTQLIEVRDLANSVVKTIKPPVQTNEIFYGGTASLILSSISSVVLYDIQQGRTIAEISSPPVK